MHESPGAVAEARAQQARHDHGQKQVEGDGSEADPDRPVLRREREHRVLQPDRRVAIEHGRQNVDRRRTRARAASRFDAGPRRRSGASAASPSASTSERRGRPPWSAEAARRRRSRASDTSRRSALPRGSRVPLRPGADVHGLARLVHEPCRQPAGREPGRRLVAEHNGGRAGGVGVDAGRTRDRYRPPGGLGRPAGARVDDVVEGRLAGLPAADERARRGEAAGRQGDRGPGASSGLAWSSATRTGQPPSGTGPASAMSPPRLTRTPAPDARAAARAARSAPSAFAVAPRSSSTPSASAIVQAERSSVTPCGPGTGAKDARKKRPSRSSTFTKRRS